MASDPHTLSNLDQTMSRRSTRWVTAVAERLWKPLVYSSAYLAFIAVAEVLIVRYLLSLPPSPAPIVVGLVTFAVYANDRLVDLDSDAESSPRRTAFVRRHRSLLYVLAAISYGLAVALSAFGGPLALALTLFPGMVWVVYALEWLPAGESSIQRLKEPFLVNSTLVAVAWSLTIVFLPVAFVDSVVSPAVGVVFTYFVLATFVNTEIANVRDIASDRQSDVRTIPVVFGVRRTRHALYGVTLLTAGILGYAVVTGILTTMAAGAFSLGLVCLLGVIACLGRIDNEMALTTAAECTRLPVLVVLAVLSL